MSMPHPRNHVIELIAEAICSASRSPAYWRSLSDQDKDGWRNEAKAALSVVEPALNWSHFVNMPDNVAEDLIY
jgi:hypothetical protein